MTFDRVEPYRIKNGQLGTQAERDMQAAMQRFDSLIGMIPKPNNGQSSAGA
jgi:hypothetical protein